MEVSDSPQISELDDWLILRLTVDKHITWSSNASHNPCVESGKNLWILLHKILEFTFCTNGFSDSPHTLELDHRLIVVCSVVEKQIAALLNSFHDFRVPWCTPDYCSSQTMHHSWCLPIVCPRSTICLLKLSNDLRAGTCLHCTPLCAFHTICIPAVTSASPTVKLSAVKAIVSLLNSVHSFLTISSDVSPVMLHHTQTATHMDWQIVQSHNCPRQSI